MNSCRPNMRFDEIAENIGDRVNPAESDAERYVGLEHLDSDSQKIRRWGTPGDVIGQKLAFREGDIIFGRRRAYQRKLAVADFDGICSAHALVVRATEDDLLVASPTSSNGCVHLRRLDQAAGRPRRHAIFVIAPGCMGSPAKPGSRLTAVLATA